MKAKEIIRNIAYGITALFLVVMFLYLLSDKVNSGISLNGWFAIHAIDTNLLIISLIVIVMTYASYYFTLFLGTVMIPIFILKCIYTVLCYLHPEKQSQQMWQNMWGMMIGYAIATLIIIYLFWYCERRRKDRESI
jgi:D-alanyl-lipoteichoic acid acyltransferase DltB (MBOAT superfamily)